MKRIDKRVDTQLRKMTATTGILSRADGSAKFSFGASSCLASVYGPMQSKQWQELIDRATIQVIITPNTGNSSPKERYLEKFIEGIVDQIILTDLHPRTLIRITCQILNDDGSVLACILNSVILALIDAGIPLNSVATAVSTTLAKDILYLDPTLKETADSDARFTIVFVGDKILAIDAHGKFSKNQVIPI